MQGSTKIQSQFDDKLLELSSHIDEFEGYRHAHGLRIAEISDALARKFNMAANDRFFMQQAALLHDIGELRMSRDYIRTNRPLSEVERLDMQRHPVVGEQEAAKRGFSRGVQLLIRWHHEWWNGMGYPDGLSGEEIPLAARILRVADSFAAMMEARPGRGQLTPDAAKIEIKSLAGIECDPSVVKLLLKNDLDLKDFHWHRSI
jgi:putative nucleotidyltransferase with HDIG domain